MSDSPPKLSTPIAKSKRVTCIQSSSKVRSAFKSPLRTPQPAGKQCISRSLTPKLSNCTTTPVSSNSQNQKLCNTAPPFRKKFKRSFAAPQKFTPVKKTRSEPTEADIETLKAEIEQQKAEIESFKNEGIEVEELQLYIEKLHDYNDVKDAGQLIIGRLAVQLQTTTKEVYPQFGLNLND